MSLQYCRCVSIYKQKPLHMFIMSIICESVHAILFSYWRKQIFMLWNLVNQQIIYCSHIFIKWRLIWYFGVIDVSEAVVTLRSESYWIIIARAIKLVSGTVMLYIGCCQISWNQCFFTYARVSYIIHKYVL